ncbi:MAG: hypothetical protein Q4E75_01985 [bacterium]|nr:hypothetical protein [bacterium]
MKKIIIIFVVLVLISIGIISCLYINNRNKESKLLDQSGTSNEVIKDIDEKKEDIENEPISEDIKDNNNDNKNITNNDVNTNKSNMESNSSSNSNVINNKNDNVTQAKEEKHETVKETVVQQPIPEPKKEPTPWESLGISEYDYYNKPMWSWARVDYSVKTYGTLEQTHQACIDAGNELDDIISFSCDNINSYSGDYLGDMLRVKK